MGCTADQQEPSEIGSAKWSWLCIPLAGFAFAAQQAEAVSVFFSNLAFATGAHLNYKRQDKEEEFAEGPTFRSE
jgi:hypothetical protein